MERLLIHTDENNIAPLRQTCIEIVSPSIFFRDIGYSRCFDCRRISAVRCYESLLEEDFMKINDEHF